MAALDPQVLLSDANCFACYGASITDLLKLSLLDRIAQNGLDPVASFVARAGLTDPTLIDAIQVLHDSAVANGWWDKCDCIYPFVGGDAVSHSQNLRSSLFPIVWTGGVIHDANGITGDGASYGDTGYILASSGLYSQNSGHLGVFRRDAGNNSRIYIGASEGGVLARVLKGLLTAVQCIMNGAGSTSASSAVFSFVVGTRSDAVNQHLMMDGVDNSGAVASTGVPNFSVFLLANNLDGAAATFSTVNLGGATIGSGLSFAEYTSMEFDWLTFNTAVGR